MQRKSTREFNLLRALEVFVAVAESRQITAAARLLGLTQSAASQQVRTLERAFGLSLVDHGARPIELTPAGIMLHRHAARLMAGVETMWAEVRRAAASPRPILRAGMLASVATTLTPCLTRIAHERFHIAEVTLHAGLASDHQLLLINRRVDLVVTSDAFYDIDELERYTVLREPFYLVVPPNSPAVDMSFTRLAKSMPIIRFSAATPVGRRIDQHLRRVRLDLARSFEADRASMVIAAVAAGEGYSFLSPSLLVDGIREGHRVTIRPMPFAPLNRTITVVTRAGDLDDLSRVLADAFAEKLRQVYATHLSARLPDGGRGVVFGDAATQQ